MNKNDHHKRHHLNENDNSHENSSHHPRLQSSLDIPFPLCIGKKSSYHKIWVCFRTAPKKENSSFHEVLRK